MLFAWLKKLNLRGKSSLPVFIICLLIAIVFWTLNSLNKEYNHTVLFPVEISNMPHAKRMISTVPENIKVLCKARGFELLWFTFKYGNKKIVIDVTGKSNSSADKISLGMMDEFVNKFKSELTDMQIVSVQPDSIHLFLSSRYIKKVPVVHQIKYTLKKQFNIYGKVKTEPDSVLVSGDKAGIDSITQIFTDEKELYNLDKNTKITLPLQKTSPSVFLSSDKVNITIPVEEFTEGKISLPVNAPLLDGKKIVLLPQSADIIYQTTLNNFQQVIADSFVLNATPFSAPHSNKLKLSLTKIPSGVKVVSIIPSSVDYYFEK